ncbi:MAG: nucleoside kinase, partial [Spirochaetaceae bacterium]|nr:nucleoside kinase [Spirochaetaceae bacterium]
MDHSMNAEVCRRTMNFLAAAAVRTALPDRAVYACHQLGSDLYYTFTGGQSPGNDEIGKLKAAMTRWIEQDAEITVRTVSCREAVEYFEKNRQADTALLLRQRGRAGVKVNRLDGFTDLYADPLLPSAGLLTGFDIFPYHDGFLLRLPSAGGKIGEFTDKPRIFSACQEYEKWGRITSVRSAAHINRLIADGGMADFIRINEAFQAKNLSEIADQIYDRRNDVKLVLIAGPSSSGKTTTAKRLSIYLKVRGIEAVVISLDDYYLHPDNVP